MSFELSPASSGATLTHQRSIPHHTNHPQLNDAMLSHVKKCYSDYASLPFERERGCVLLTYDYAITRHAA